MAHEDLVIPAPSGFRLRSVAISHGWFDLPPLQWNREAGVLSAVIRLPSAKQSASDGTPVTVEITQPSPRRLKIRAAKHGRWSQRDRDAVTGTVRRMLGADRDLSEFFRAAGARYDWAKQAGVGRMLRAGSVFEDAVKMLATTNCSWALTKQMIGRLVDRLGEPAPGGGRAFPTPAAMAAPNDEFYRNEIRAGYRGPYFRAFAERVAGGSTLPETWADFPGTMTELCRAIRENKGFGRYAAENLCKLLGRFDGLGLDSWCLKKFPQVHGPFEGEVEPAIRNHYAPFGVWQGLALWLDLTRDWHDRSDFDQW